MIQTSAPGKLLLLGDYAVVYNNPCLVTAVDKRLYVEAEIIDKDEDEILTPQVKESRFVLSLQAAAQIWQLFKSCQIYSTGLNHRIYQKKVDLWARRIKIICKNNTFSSNGNTKNKY